VAIVFAFALHTVSVAEDTPPSRQAIAFKQALAIKGAADEQFLLGRGEEAKRSYLDASEVLRGLSPNMAATTRDQKDLLDLEISYRLALLSRGLPFFFSTNNQDTANPIAIRKSFDRNLKELLQLKTELLSLESNLHSDKRVITTTRAKELMADEHLEVSQLEEEKAEAIQDAQIDRKAKLEERVSQVKSRREALVAEAKQKLQAMDAVQQRINAIAISTISSALGLPVDAQQLAKGKLDEKTVLNLASSLVGPDAARLGESLGDLGKAADEIVKTYRSAVELKAETEKGIAGVEAVRKAVTDPSLQSLLAVGAALDVRMPADISAQLDQAIAASKPFAALVRLGGVSTEARDALNELVATQDELRTFLERIDSLFTDADLPIAVGWYADIIIKLFSEVVEDADKRRVVVDLAVRSWPDALLVALGPDADILIRETTVGSRAALLDRLAAQGLAALPGLEISGQDIRIPRIGRTLSIARTFEGLSTDLFRQSQAGLAGLQQNLKALTALKPESFVRIAVKELPQTAIESLVAKMLAKGGHPAARAEALYAELLEAAGPQAGKISVQLRALVGGSIVGSSMLEQRPRQGKGSDIKNRIADAQAGRPSKANAGEVAASVALGALSAAFPAVGAAVAAVKVIDGIGELNDLADCINGINGEVQELVKEELRLRDLYDEAQLQIQIADYERRIALQSQRISKQLMSLYQSEVFNVSANMVETRFRMKAKEARLFLHMELLRRNFALLDEALRIWGQPASSPRGRIASAIESDPQFLRYALDNDIHLFDWLDASKSPNRSDYEAVAEHWQKVKVFIDEACQRLGCSEDSFEIGEINQTAEVSVLDLLSPGEREAFRAWQKSSDGTPFTMWLDFRSDRRLPNGDRFLSDRFTNVRVVSLGFASVADKVRDRVLGIELYHPGTAYIPTPGGGFVDARMPVGATSIPIPEDLKIPALKARWVAPAGVERSVFDGYGLLTMWRLTLYPNQQLRSMQDLRLRFVYQYFSPLDVPRKDLRAQVQLIEDLDVELDSSFLRTLGSASDAQRKVDDYKKKLLAEGP